MKHLLFLLLFVLMYTPIKTQSISEHHTESTQMLDIVPIYSDGIYLDSKTKELFSVVNIQHTAYYIGNFNNPNSTVQKSFDSGQTHYATLFEIKPSLCNGEDCFVLIYNERHIGSFFEIDEDWYVLEYEDNSQMPKDYQLLYAHRL